MIGAWCLRNNQRGNSMLEMLLFTPLGLLFLFGVIDGGLAFTERAAVRDALRAAVAAEARLSVAAFSADNTIDDFQINSASIQDLASSLSAELLEQLAATQQITSDEIAARFKVAVIAAELRFDSTTGALTNSNLVAEHQSGEFNLAAAVPNADILSPQNALQLALARDSQALPSPYALPLTPLVTANGSSAHFAPQSLALLIQVDALPRGLHPSLAASFFGRLFAFQESKFFVLRQQLR